MAQLMRGIFFPNSNLIFTVQTRDPGAPAPPPSANQTGGLLVRRLGRGIYGGWELVDNAALALADASPLMLTPGIRCENGRLAPVTDPDWIKFTEQMIAVARRILPPVADEKPGGGRRGDRGSLRRLRRLPPGVSREPRTGRRGADPTDPSNKAARCMSRSSGAR